MRLGDRMGMDDEEPGRLEQFIGGQEQQRKREQGGLLGAPPTSPEQARRSPIATPEPRDALPQHMPPGMAMPPMWAAQRQDPVWLAQNGLDASAAIKKQLMPAAVPPAAAAPAAAPAVAPTAVPGAATTAAAPAGAAGAAGGAAAAAPVLAVIGDYLQRQEQNKGMRKDAIANMRARSAASFGAPMYGVQAAQTRQAIDENEGSNLLAKYLGGLG